MNDVLREYKEVPCNLPDKIFAWHLYGAGVENFGKDRKPVEVPMPEYGPDELLVRIDAVGICFSDIKVINQGDKHPRLVGRDLVDDPVILGHETAVTVVGIGDKLKGEFKIGERFIVQPDVFYGGKSMAFGYALPGGQTQYQVLGKEILEGDEGRYLLPMRESTGYAEAAIAEPWACVVASYRITRRPTIKPGGVMWIIGAPGNDGNYSLDLEITSRVVIATDLKGSILKQLISGAQAGKFRLISKNTFENINIKAQSSEYNGFDDIIILGADAGIVEKTAPYMAHHAIMNIVASESLERPVQIDVGKIHYLNHSYIGTTGRSIGGAYNLLRVPSELKPGGIAWFIGGGGPMGQMHVQRAVELANGPSKILTTDIDTPRLNTLKERFSPIAGKRGVQVDVINPNEVSEEDFDRLLNEFTGGKGFDDIVVLAPVAELIGGAAPYLGAEGLMNIFAGVPIGTIANIDLTGVYTKQMRLVGSSGSKLSDLQDTLTATEEGELSTNTSVAAIGGLEAAWDGMVSVKEGRFPGRVVIYPQIHGLDLTALPDLKDKLPNVYAKLTHGMFWNNAAEEELIRSMIKPGC